MKVDQEKLRKLVDETTEEEIAIAKAICDKYNVTPTSLMIVGAGVQALGVGRNRQGAQLLRAVADLMESPIARYEDLVERCRVES